MASTVDRTLVRGISLWLCCGFVLMSFISSVTCQIDYIDNASEGEVRLVDGLTQYEGRVEIYHDGEWGTVCDDYWDEDNARVVCRQLGYSDEEAEAMVRATYGQGCGPIYLDNVRCTGDETSLSRCDSCGWGNHDCHHSEDAGVRCNGTMDGAVRLVNGLTQSEGRVEIYHDGEWGTVCDDSWDDTDAMVVCRQLGHSIEGSIAMDRATYGEGSGPIYLDDVDCTGNEGMLSYCDSNGWGVHNCAHREDAGVQCGEDFIDGEVRLVDGLTHYEGRVEIYHDGVWGTVCDDYWDEDDASVVCRQLGYSDEGAEAMGSATYGQGSGPIYLDDVRCRGNESRLSRCDSREWGSHDCYHSEDAGVRCNDIMEGEVRLVNGFTEYEGRVEIFQDGTWGTVCDNGWNTNDARVVCRQLGYPIEGAEALIMASFGEGSGPIHLDDVRCTGSEYGLIYCDSNGWGSNNCGHQDDAGVRCGDPNEEDVRLVDGLTQSDGRVEIYHDGAWGTVCDDSWDDTDAMVVCRQLGFSSEGSVAMSSATYGEGSGPIYLDNVDCTGTEGRLSYCDSNGWGVHNCAHREDAGVQCGDFIDGEVRLVNGQSPYEGRVEIYHDDHWGTVCDDYWDDDDAQVVCRQLGYSTDGAEALSRATYGQGFGPIYLDDVNCEGYESRLSYCGSNGWGVNNCGHSDDAGVQCGDAGDGTEGDVRLVDGFSSDEGRVEIYHNGQWGTVCDDYWDDNDARVVCRQLGYFDDGARAMSGATYGEGTGPIYLDDVSCYGYESRLTYCSNNGWGVHNCRHSEDAGVQCFYDSPSTGGGMNQRVVGILAFAGVSLFLLSVVSIIAVCYTCNRSKARNRTQPTVYSIPINPDSATAVNGNSAATYPRNPAPIAYPSATMATDETDALQPPPTYASLQEEQVADPVPPKE